MKKYVIALALMVAGNHAYGQSFQHTLDNIVANAPEIKALALENKAESEAMAQENILEGPELEGFHKWGTKGETKYGIGISQGFDWPGLYRARKAARKANDNALEQLQRSTVADRTLEVKQLMIQLITLREQLNLITTANDNTTRLLKLYERSYRAGEVSILDVNKLKIEGLRLSRRATALNDQIETIQQTIVSIAGSSECIAALNNMTVADIPADPILSEADAERLIDNSPAILYSRAMQESAQQMERVVKLSGYPSFSLGYELEREDGQYFNGISVNIGLPSWSNRHKRAAARYSVLEQEVKLDAARLGEILKMRRLRTAAQRARTDEQMLRSVLETTNQAELLEKALKGGQISLLTYLQETGYFIDAKCDYFETVNNAAQLCAELNKYNF